VGSPPGARTLREVPIAHLLGGGDSNSRLAVMGWRASAMGLDVARAVRFEDRACRTPGSDGGTAFAWCEAHDGRAYGCRVLVVGADSRCRDARIVCIASAAGAVAPVLVSTDPAAGATGVNPLLGSFALTFDQPMRNQGSLAITGPWGAGELLFVGDRIFVHSRSSSGTELPAGATISVTVNPAGSTNPFVNLAGQAAATTSFSFTIAPGGASPHVQSSVPSRGAIDVSAGLGSIVVQFSEPMNPSYRSFTLPSAWARAPRAGHPTTGRSPSCATTRASHCPRATWSPWC